MSTLHFSANAVTAAHEITHDGRAYLVSPVVALRAGVLNGVLVQADEFAKYAQSWSGRPCPISHPQLNGQYISANSPDVWAAHVPGHFWNVQVDGDALKGEIWIDIAKAEAMGERAISILKRLRLGQPVEVSTGYFADTEPSSGILNGKSYSGIARNIRPDHLALLPDEVGACSWADGCGTPRVHAQEEPMQDSRSILERFLNWWQQQDLQGSLTPAPESVTANDAPCHCNEKESPDMAKLELVTALVANSKCKFSKEKLESWEEADLVALSESLADEPQADPEPTSSEPAAAALGFDALLARISGLEELLKGVTANADNERKQLIATIVANASSTWGNTDLQRLDTETLRKIQSSVLPRDYSGNGGYYRQNDPEEEELVMHWPIFEAKGS